MIWAQPNIAYCTQHVNIRGGGGGGGEKGGGGGGALPPPPPPPTPFTNLKHNLVGIKHFSSIAHSGEKVKHGRPFFLFLSCYGLCE